MAKRARMSLPPGWKAEVVTPRMKKACKACGEVPNGDLRLVRTVDSYPYPTSEVYCPACAIATMEAWVQAVHEQVRALKEQHGTRS